MPSPPAIIFVHGAWHTPECWSKVIPRLEAQNYLCSAVRLASTLGNPEANLGDDVAVVRSTIKEHTSQGRNVLLIGHSYGGIVASSAIEGLTRPKYADDAETSGTGYVVGLMLIATGFVRTGESLFDTFAGASPEGAVSIDGENGWCNVGADPRTLFYNDLSVEEAAQWGAKLQKQALAALVDNAHSSAGWMKVLVWFLAAKQDQIVFYEAQKRAYEAAIEEGANVTVLELDSGHSPFLSLPRETTNFIQEAILTLS